MYVDLTSSNVLIIRIRNIGTQLIVGTCVCLFRYTKSYYLFYVLNVINSLTFSKGLNNIRANVSCNLSKSLFNLGFVQMGKSRAKNQSRAA